MSKQPTLTVVESLLSETKSYVDNRIQLLKLKAVDKTSSVVSSLISYVVLLIIGVIVFIFINIALALLIGDLLGDHSWLGFLIVAVVYGIVGFIVFAKRGRFFKEPIVKAFISKIL